MGGCRGEGGVLSGRGIWGTQVCGSVDLSAGYMCVHFYEISPFCTLMTYTAWGIWFLFQ